MEDIYVTCKEANIEAAGRGIIELIVSVDAGQKDGLLDNFDNYPHDGWKEMQGVSYEGEPCVLHENHYYE